MNRNRGLVGLSLLCALVFCAVAAPSASANKEKGTTLFTCVGEKGGTKDWSDSHCTSAVTPGTGNFGHEVIAAETTDYVTTNTLTVTQSNAVFRSTIGKGQNLEIVCTTVLSEGQLTNEAVGKFMRVKGSKISTSYAGCTVPQPTGEGCKVAGEKFAFSLASLSFEEMEGVEKGVQFTPAEGKKLGEVNIQGCKDKELNKAYAFEGSFISVPVGSTTPLTVAMTEKTLTLSGQKASLEGSTTKRMAPFEGKVMNPLVMTTIK